MSNRARPVPLGLHSLILIAVLLVTGCGSSEDGRYSSLLRLVPDQSGFRDGITIVDYEAIRALPGTEATRPLGATDEELADDPLAISKALGWHGIGAPLSEILGFWLHDDLSVALRNLEMGFGLGLGDVDLALTGGVEPPRTLHIVAGEGIGSAAPVQLERCRECLPAETKEYAGQEYFSWGEEQRLRIRIAPPAYDWLGRGGNFVFDGDYIIRSNFIDELEASIDAEQGRGSLLDDDDFALLAEAIDSLEIVAVFVTAQTVGPARQAEIIDSFGSNEAMAPLVAEWDVPDGVTLLRPYRALAIAIGVADDEPFTTMILVHESPSDAEANVERLRTRLESGGPDESTRYADLFTATEITSDGRVLLATLRGAARLPANYLGEPILIHE